MESEPHAHCGCERQDGVEVGHVAGVVVEKSVGTHGECGEKCAVVVDRREIDAEIVGELGARFAVLFGIEQLPVAYGGHAGGVYEPSAGLEHPVVGISTHGAVAAVVEGV